jgi:signal peptidase I
MAQLPTPTAAQALSTSPAKDRSAWREWVDIVQSIACALVIAFVLRTLVFQPFTIPSSSMEPGLLTGDYIFVSKFAYGWSRASVSLNPPLLAGRLFGRVARRGDVVVFRLPRDPQQTWIKRVIGLPGDRVQVLGGKVLVNGRRLDRQVLGLVDDHDMPGRPVLQAREVEPDGRAHLIYAGAPDHEGETTGVYVVPTGSYFVMGDNRDNSLDSRFPRELGVGFLPAENIVGKAEFVLASWKPGSALIKPWTWLSLQPGRFLQRID